MSEHVKVWFTDMLPNIGLFLCRGNSKTAEVFRLAWKKYEVVCSPMPNYVLLYDTIQYNTIQYNTIQYNTIQYNTIQYNTIQYNTIRHN